MVPETHSAKQRRSTTVRINNHGIVFHPSYNGTTNQTMFAANDGGVYKTDNAKQAMLVTPAA